MGMDSPSYSIVADQLTKRFGRHIAIKDLSFSIPQGEIVGFLGPNGAGKSTTLRILTGILPASSGYAAVCGLPVATCPHRVRRQIGYMPENNPLPEELRVWEYLRFRARIKGIPHRRRKEAINRALEVCELHRKARRRIIGTLSKGFRQRVGIADAILGSPPVTILDEPTIGLDPHQVLAIRKLLDQLRGHTTVILSSHILSEVEVSCDRVLILNQGTMVASGTADDLRREFLPGSRFSCDVRGPRDSLLHALRSIPPPWETSLQALRPADLHRVQLLHPEPDQPGEPLLKALLQSKALGVRSFQPVEPTLEEIFLTATRRSWDASLREENPSNAPSQPLSASS